MRRNTNEAKLGTPTARTAKSSAPQWPQSNTFHSSQSSKLFDFGQAAPAEPSKRSSEEASHRERGPKLRKTSAAASKAIFSDHQPLEYYPPPPVAPIDFFRANTDPKEVYTEIFLCHAKVWTFADKWAVKDLAVLALDNLKATLGEFHLYSERVQDVAELLRYTYQHTTESSPLRSLVKEYLTSQIETIFEHFRSISDLVLDDNLSKETRKELSEDLGKIVWSRL